MVRTAKKSKSRTAAKRAPKRAAKSRFVNLGANGKPTTGEHVAVLDRHTGLTWTAAPLNAGQGFTHEDALKACSAVTLLGKRDWRAPTVQELLSIIDYDRWNPAVDPAHFKGPYSWTWASTLVKGEGAPSGCARDVSLSGGYSCWDSQDDRGQALAVRASQSLASR
jgi:hypothetical protein